MTSDHALHKLQQRCSAWGNSLIFSQVLVDLDVAPDFAATIDTGDVAASRAHTRQVKPAEHARRMVEQVAEAPGRGSEVEKAANREVRDRVAQDNGIVKRVKEGRRRYLNCCVVMMVLLVDGS